MLILLVASWVVLGAQQNPKGTQPICPAHEMPMRLNERGEAGMGFLKQRQLTTFC